MINGKRLYLYLTMPGFLPPIARMADVPKIDNRICMYWFTYPRPVCDLRDLLIQAMEDL